jgi:hypothetical protein
MHVAPWFRSSMQSRLMALHYATLAAVKVAQAMQGVVRS